MRAAFPRGFESWWSLSLRLWQHQIDELGHLTAAQYPLIYEEAAFSFVTELFRDPRASYVTVRSQVDYPEEIVIERSPVTVHIAVAEVGRSSFGLTMVMSDREAHPCNLAQYRYVRWNMGARSKQELTTLEREALRTHLPAV